MASGGSQAVTTGGKAQMSKQDIEKFAIQMPASSRPSLINQQSSSLPSTPYIHARKLSDDCQTPSPITKGAETTSPRSARSESDSTSRPPGRTPFLAGCKYETGMAYSRRRIPYSVGGDRLENAPSNPKKYLNPDEESRLSADMRVLYNRILPSDESEDRRARFLQKLDKILNDQWPGNNIKVHVFGSSGNMLCTSDSDVDICITTPMKALERVCLIAKALAEHGMERVVCVPQAKVPIVKIWDPELELSCDMNVNNTLALENTRMIRTYVEIDPRVRPLAMVIKHWTRRRILNDAALGGTLSSYTWICLIVNFLQTRHPPILPALQKRPHQCRMNSEGKLSSFADDIETLRGFGKPNKETIGELLFHFFRRYSYEIDFEKNVISIREGQLISKLAKNWHLMQNNRLCVEEPFNTQRNLGNTADDISFRGVHVELRRAFDLLSKAKLEECCEEYVFPLIEEKIWTKPAPQPRPVLSRSMSQSSRPSKSTGPNARSQTTSQRSRTTNSSRRASSAASSNKMNNFSLGQQGGPGSANDRAAGIQIHAHLFHHYQLLQQQEAQLRLHMHQRAQADLHLHVTSQLQPLQIPMPSFGQSGTLDGFRQQSNIDSAPLSAPLRNMGFYHPMQMTSNPLPSPTMQSTTNPSSPSMASVQPAHPELRRGLHRSTTNDSSLATLRSHSQPATNARRRSQQPSRAIPMVPSHTGHQQFTQGYPTLHQYQQAFLQAQAQSLAELQHPERLSRSPNMNVSDSPPDEAVPTEYVGYFVGPSQRPQNHDFDSLIPPIPSYHELGRSERGFSPGLTRFRAHTSRSPSPSSSVATRHHSISFYSAAPAPVTIQNGKNNAGYFRSSGPIIVDGSGDTDYDMPSESLRRASRSDVASFSDDQSLDTATTMHTNTPPVESETGFPLDTSPEYRVTSSANMLKFGDFPIRTSTRATPVPRHEDFATSKTRYPSSTSSHGQVSRESSNGLGIDIFAPASKEILPAIPRASSIPTGNVSGVIPPLALEKVLKPLPLLSPVREVRTPSPTATRNSQSYPMGTQNLGMHGRSLSLSGKEMLSSPLSAGARTNETAKGKARVIEGQVRPLMTMANGAANGSGPGNGSTGKSLKPQGSLPIQISSWQQTGKKGKKERSKGGSVGSISMDMDDGGERKGG